MMNLGERAPMILIWTCLYVIQNTDSTIYCMYITGICHLKRSHISTTFMLDVFGRELEIPMNLKFKKKLNCFIFFPCHTLRVYMYCN